jgi:hypothetical protein
MARFSVLAMLVSTTAVFARFLAEQPMIAEVAGSRASSRP